MEHFLALLLRVTHIQVLFFLELPALAGRVGSQTEGLDVFLVVGDGALEIEQLV